MLGEPVVVEDCEDEGLVEGLAVGDALEGERLVEERVQRLPVHLRLELALLVRHQVDLSARVRARALFALGMVFKEKAIRDEDKFGRTDGRFDINEWHRSSFSDTNPGEILHVHPSIFDRADFISIIGISNMLRYVQRKQTAAKLISLSSVINSDDESGPASNRA